MGRLVITRKTQQSFVIGKDIVVTVVDINRNQAKISISAPNEVRVLRSELVGREKRSG